MVANNHIITNDSIAFKNHLVQRTHNDNKKHFIFKIVLNEISNNFKPLTLIEYSAQERNNNTCELFSSQFLIMLTTCHQFIIYYLQAL